MLTYNSYVEQIRRLAVVEANDSEFAAIIPGMIDYAEQRIYRELNLLATDDADGTQSCVAGQRTLALPVSPYFVNLTGVNIITPAATAPDSGTRNPLLPVSKHYIDAVYGSSSTAGVPIMFAMLDDQTVIFGPWPSAAYRVEFVGSIRPAPLSQDNTTTFISQRLPDLLIAASMIYFAGYQRDFGQQSDDPKLAQSWELQYKTLVASADTEEMRKRFLSARKP